MAKRCVSLADHYLREVNELRGKLIEHEYEIILAHRAVFEMLPPVFYDIANSYPRNQKCENWYDDHLVWRDEVIAKVIEQANLVAFKNYLGFPVAPCPLCHRVPHTMYAEGFAVPGGLELHLLGKGTARLCPVMKSILYVSQYKAKFNSVENMVPPGGMSPVTGPINNFDE